MTYTVERMSFPYAMEWQIVDSSGEAVEIGFETYAEAAARAEELPGSEELPGNVWKGAEMPFAANH